MRHLFICLILFLVGNQFLIAQNSEGIEKHYITLISNFEQVQGKITKLQKNKENLLITVQSGNIKKDIALHNTVENLVLFESAKVGYMLIFKMSEGQCH